MTSFDQEGLFATGLEPGAYDLPHPRIAPRVILLVRRVLIAAFALLRKRCHEGNESLATLKENAITLRLRAIIENDFRMTGTSVPGFDRHTFDPVYRQTKVENYNFTAVQKEPDMLFRIRSDEEPLRVISSQHALFVECKPVDSGHPGGSSYCDDGLKRFVLGDYAWAMQDALMVAYVRDGRTIHAHLAPAMKERSALEVEQAVTPVFKTTAPADPETEQLHASVHRRSFSWCGGKGPACPITVYHSWHQAGG
jgi:hypothetical protein